MIGELEPTCGGNGGALVAGVADRYAALDAARMVELDRLLREGARCRYCRGKLSDAMMARSPGVCARRPCRRALRREIEAKARRSLDAARESQGGGFDARPSL